SSVSGAGKTLRCLDAEAICRTKAPCNAGLLSNRGPENGFGPLGRDARSIAYQNLGKVARAYEERHRELRRRAKEGLDQLVAAVKFLLDPCRSRETTLAELCRQVNEEGLHAALASFRAFQHLEERGFVDEISSYLRRYFPTLFELPFEAEPGS